MNRTIPTYVDLSLDSILEVITGGLEHEEIFEFIKELDLTVADYDFTKRLRDHFISVIEEEDDLDENK